jgi:hypothetical protein
MIVSAWLHTGDDVPLEGQIAEAKRHGLTSIRSYGIEYAQQAAPTFQQLGNIHKDLILSEIGLPSAVGYHIEGEQLVVPESDNPRYEEAMYEFAHRIVEQSPIHVSFGLCDRIGKAKIDIQRIVQCLQP